MRKPAISVDCAIWRHQGRTAGKRIIPEETAVAFSYDGGTYAVMMATPQNLEDFAFGFSVTEGLVSSASRNPSARHRRTRFRNRASHVARRAARRRVERAAATSGGSDGLRALRHREPRRGRAFVAARARGRDFYARRNHARARRIGPPPGTQPSNACRPRCGILAPGRENSLQCGKTSADTTRSTNSRVRSCATTYRATTAWCC